MLEFDKNKRVIEILEIAGELKEYFRESGDKDSVKAISIAMQTFLNDTEIVHDLEKFETLCRLILKFLETGILVCETREKAKTAGLLPEQYEG